MSRRKRVETAPGPKDDLERRKLLLEIEQLQQPWWKKPTYILAALPTVLAFGTLLVGVLTGYFQATATKLENQRRDLEKQIEQFNVQKQELDRQVKELNERKEQATAATKEVEDRLNAIEAEWAEVERAMSKPASHNRKQPNKSLKPTAK